MGKNKPPLLSKLFAYSLAVGLLLVCGLLFSKSAPVLAASGTNTQINFQGRLLNAAGATVPDGYYNIEFKIYQDGDGQSTGDTTGSPAGTLKWTEDYLNANSQGVVVQNGFLSVQLGSITPFGNNINWNQDTLWLSMNIAGTAPSCTPFASCSPDGEMIPMKRLSSSAYAENSGQLGGLASSQFLQIAQGVQTDASTVSSLFINKSGATGNILELQSGGTDSLVIGNAGDLTFGANANHTLSVSTAGAGVAGKSLTLAGGGAGTGGSALAGGNLVLQGGTGGGTNGGGGNITIDAGAKNGTGSDGTIGIGTLHASTVQIGSTTAAVNQTIAIGNNGTASSSTAVTVGSTIGASPTTIQAGSSGITLTGAVSASSTINAVSGFSFNSTAGATVTCSAGQFLNSQIVQGGIITNTAGACVSANSLTTMQNAYDNSAASPLITLSSAGKGLFIRDASTTVGGNLFAVQNNGQTINYLAVTTSGASVAGTFSASGVITGSSFVGSGLDVASAGTLSVGASVATTIQIGNVSLASGTQAINIGTNSTSGGTTNVTIGSGSGATAGTTAIQSKSNTTITTNGVTRATFDTTGKLYLGNGITAGTPTNFVITGTGSSTTGVAGAQLTIQGGNATVGNANGGNLLLSGGTGFGTGVNGLVVLSTPTFQTASSQTCATSCTITQSNVDGNGSVVVNATGVGLTVTMNNPTITTYGKVVYVTAANGSNDFTLSVNGGGTGNQVAMRSNTTATMIWGAGGWTAAGASSSTTLQAAYNNTLTSAGGAELVVSNGSNANGLTIRDSSANPVNGTLLEVQNQQAADLFSVNDGVTDYANNGGAESAFGAEWAAINGATVSRYTASSTYIANGTGSTSIATSTTALSGAKNILTTSLTAGIQYNVSFAARLTSGSAAFTNLQVYYSVNGTAQSVACTNYSTQAIATSVWTKVNCSFTAPSSGITSSNALFVQQTTSGTARTFYIDNLSVTVSGNLNYATDGGVDDNTNFGTNWTAVSGAAVTRSTSVGNDTSDSAQVVTTATAGMGVRNKLSITPFTNTLYRMTVYVASSNTFNDFTVRYSRDGGTNFTSCVDYNTQSISTSTSSFTQVTCYITTDGTAASNPYVYFTQNTGTARTYYVDTFSMTLGGNTVQDVQIGGGVTGGPVTLFTLDSAASAPIAANNNALLGSMYYDTTLGKLQCYEADGWGACGSSPDNIVTISPEYTNAVMHGTGVGTMVSDFCSGSLHINDGSGVPAQPTICGSNETYNFYKWTSPQATPQSYSIYVTYQLPDTFKSFASGQTSIMGRTDSSNSTVQYEVYKNDSGSGLTACGTTVAVSTGSVSSWQPGLASGAADPSTCGFVPGDSIVFKIDVTASSNANAYVGNLGFTFTNS